MLGSCLPARGRIATGRQPQPLQQQQQQRPLRRAVRRWREAAAAAGAPAAAEAAAGSAQAAPLPPPPPPPSQQLQSALAQTATAWARAALASPLQLPQQAGTGGGGVRVVLLGVCWFAPQQAVAVQHCLDAVGVPSALLIEQPPPAAAAPGAPGAGAPLLLPSPAWLQAVMEALQEAEQQQQGQQPQQQLLQQLLADRLRGVTPPSARVGRDVVDEWETFGFYAGLDLVRSPEAIAQVAALCGFVPGEELAVAAQHALSHGVPLSCIDAPVKLQEVWVQRLLDGFTLSTEQLNALSATVHADFAANQQLAAAQLPAALEWDRQLAAAAAELQQQAALAADAAAVGSATPQQQQQLAEQQALLLFKVSKATAAALLPPDDQQQAEVLTRMQRLQPLKWRHLGVRTRHMARQIREAAAAAARQASSSSGVSGQQQEQQTLLAVVGRQHVAGIRRLWLDPQSELWAGDVPRGFAASVIEPADAAADKKPSAA